MNRYLETDDLTITYYVSGRFRPATFTDPAEYPDCDILKIEDADGNEVDIRDTELNEDDVKNQCLAEYSEETGFPVD